MMDIKEVLLFTVYKFFDKKPASLADKSAKGSGVKNDIKQNNN